jgi:hypothetical protein
LNATGFKPYPCEHQSWFQNAPFEFSLRHYTEVNEPLPPLPNIQESRSQRVQKEKSQTKRVDNKRADNKRADNSNGGGGGGGGGNFFNKKREGGNGNNTGGSRRGPARVASRLRQRIGRLFRPLEMLRMVGASVRVDSP